MKKAQVKFGETLAVIIVVYLMILVGSIWYNNINQRDLEKIFQDDQVNRAFEKYYFISNLDLLRVSQRGKLDATFDYHSLKTFYNFSKSDQGKEFIRTNLGEATIQLYLYNSSIFDSKNDIDEKINSFENFTLYNYSLQQRSNKEIFWSVIPVKDPLIRGGSNTYLGVLRVEIPFER